MISMLWLLLPIPFALFLLSLFTIRQQHEGIIERFGKFSRIAKPGLNIKYPFIDNVYIVNLKVRQLDVKVETKTLDNVFININISVQYLISDAQTAFYKLSNPEEQISAYIFDVVRAEVPKLDLDNVFIKKDNIAEAVKSELADAMKDFGYTIIKTLVTDIDPNSKVKEAMNEINAATRLRQAATERGEAEKIIIVKRAEAEAESKALQGNGIARERVEIAKGLEESMKIIQASVEDNRVTDQQILSILMMTQYFDTMKAVGSGEGTHTLFVPNGPGAVGDLQAQIISAMGVVNKKHELPTSPSQTVSTMAAAANKRRP